MILNRILPGAELNMWFDKKANPYENFARQDQHSLEKEDQTPLSEEDEEEPYSFALRGPYWRELSLYPSRLRYELDNCEVWEYQVKEEQAIVVQRLRDRLRFDLSSVERAEYEVVNGCLQLNVIERRNSERQDYSDREDEDQKFRLLLQPYSPRALETLRKSVIWHQVHGAIKYFILSRHFRGKSCTGFWTERRRRLEESFSKIASEAEKLGAKRDEDGQYTFPTEATDSQKRDLRLLFWSDDRSRPLSFWTSSYEYVPFQDVVEQEQIREIINAAIA
jgi:hypothetical protein